MLVDIPWDFSFHTLPIFFLTNKPNLSNAALVFFVYTTCINCLYCFCVLFPSVCQKKVEVLFPSAYTKGGVVTFFKTKQKTKCAGTAQSINVVSVTGFMLI